MYNSYAYTRSQTKAKEESKDLQKSAKLLKAQQNLREKLLKKYKFRIAQRIIDLVSNPVPVSTKAQVKSQKLLGESFMRTKPKDSRARIEEAFKQNNVFNLEPSNRNPNDLRPRKKNLELKHEFKNYSKNRYQRLVDKWIAEKKMISSWESSDAGKYKSGSMKKLYFKSIETVALSVSPESCSKDNSMVMLREISEESGNDESLVNDSKKLGILAHTALKKCKLRPVRDVRFISAKRLRMFYS